jgi:hypothetical protein
MTRGEYLDMGTKEHGRAGWLDHLQETSPRHGPKHAAAERASSPDLPSALADERLPGRAPEPAPRAEAGQPAVHA